MNKKNKIIFAFQEYAKTKTLFEKKLICDIENMLASSFMLQAISNSDGKGGRG